MSRSIISVLLVSVLFRTTAAIYNLAQDYSGDSFFQGWDFFTAPDPTSGHVLYQSQADALSKGLIRTQTATSSNATKQVYIGVDSTNQATNGRASVRISTQETFQHALVLADIAHQPGGICGVWPAFWMVGANWPQEGEIDIVEGVSTQATNQMTLHTSSGPILDHQAQFSGTLLTSNCDVDAPNQATNAGCGIADDSNVTFGTDFNVIGGGVYATEWTNQFIKIWFFPRNKIPQDIQSGNPTPSSAWGTPNSLFQGTFDMDDHFQNLSIVLNTAFCGDWAGAVWSQTPECAALAPTCDEYVTKNPAAFQQAFWLVNSIKVFQDNGSSANSSAPESAPSSVPTASPPLATAPTTTLPAAVTLTQTFTVYSTAVHRSHPPASFTGLSTRPHPTPNDNKTIGVPDEVYELSGRDTKNRGGAVIPLIARRKHLHV